MARTGSCSTLRRICASRSRRAPQLAPPSSAGARASPIKAVALTNGDVDHVAGLSDAARGAAVQRLCLAARARRARREPDFRYSGAGSSSRASICRSGPRRKSAARASTSGSRRSFRGAGKDRALSRGRQPSPTSARRRQTRSACGLSRRLQVDRSSIFPVARGSTKPLASRLTGAALVFFDGTLWHENEMIEQGLMGKTGSRMGTSIWSGPDGSIAAFAGLMSRERYSSISTIPIRCSTPPRNSARRRSPPVGRSARTDMSDAMNETASADAFRSPAADRPPQFEAALRAVGAERYHDKHPFHKRCMAANSTRARCRPGRSTATAIRKAVPRKDAAFISRVHDRELRREWIHRLHDHDGLGEEARRHRTLADADRRAWPVSRLCGVAARRAAGDKIRGRGLCALCRRTAARRRGRVLADRTFRAADPSRAHLRHAGEL